METSHRLTSIFQRSAVLLPLIPMALLTGCLTSRIPEESIQRDSQSGLTPKTMNYPAVIPSRTLAPQGVVIPWETAVEAYWRVTQASIEITLDFGVPYQALLSVADGVTSLQVNGEGVPVVGGQTLWVPSIPARYALDQGVYTGVSASLNVFVDPITVEVLAACEITIFEGEAYFFFDMTMTGESGTVNVKLSTDDSAGDLVMLGGLNIPLYLVNDGGGTATASGETLE
jgi:hypothetical protein